jgi:hypothetical protein
LRAAGEIAGATTSQVVNVAQTTSEREPDDLDKRAREILERREREGGLTPRRINQRGIGTDND